MIEAGRTPGAPRIDVEPDIAVADRLRAAGLRLVRGAHAEHRLIEQRRLRIVFADDGDVVDLGKHCCLRCRVARSCGTRATSARLRPMAASRLNLPVLCRKAL